MKENTESRYHDNNRISTVISVKLSKLLVAGVQLLEALSSRLDQSLPDVLRHLKYVVKDLQTQDLRTGQCQSGLLSVL